MSLDSENPQRPQFGGRTEVRDNTTRNAILLVVPSVLFLLAEALYPAFHDFIFGFHEWQLSVFPTYATDVVGLILVSWGSIFALADYRTIGTIQPQRNDAGRTLLSVGAVVLGIVLVAVSRTIQIPWGVGIVNIVAIVLAMSVFPIARTNRG